MSTMITNDYKVIVDRKEVAREPNKNHGACKTKVPSQRVSYLGITVDSSTESILHKHTSSWLLTVYRLLSFLSKEHSSIQRGFKSLGRKLLT